VTSKARPLITTDEAWVDGWRGPSVFELRDASLHYLSPLADLRGTRETIHLPGTVLPGFRDSHVHLGLVDAAELLRGGLARVFDLGWEPARAARWKDPADLEVEIVGGFLTPPGGYPSRSSWAPEGSCRFISIPDEAAAAIEEMRGLGASMIKIVLNSDAGPVWSDELLAEVVSLAHARSLPVVAHAQGRGQAVRAARAGVDLLAHTPWSERLADDDIALLAARCRWISTLDIHGWGRYGGDYGIALDNLRRFAAAGGVVLYGTDLGNGPLPAGINRREIAALVDAGLGLAAIVGSLASGPVLPGATLGPRLSWIAGPRAADAHDAAEWISSVEVLSVSGLEGMSA
jgi:imidazolonepropionase-like amidohydrolase